MPQTLEELKKEVERRLHAESGFNFWEAIEFVYDSALTAAESAAPEERKRGVPFTQLEWENISGFNSCRTQYQERIRNLKANHG